MYLTLVSIILLSLATRKTNASHNAIHIQEILTKMVETEQTSSNSKIKPFDTDEIIIDFLGNTMETYNDWLAKDDPLGPDPTEIILSTAGLKGELTNELNAVLKISNQRIVDHSRSGLSLVFPHSKRFHNNLAVARAILDGPDVIFTGDYTATGFFKVSPSLSIPFYGKGWWTFYGSDMAELVMYEGYNVNQNGNINVSASLSSKYVCLITWNDVEFKGLQFDYAKEIDFKWMSMLQRELADLYRVFLKHPLAFEKFKNHIPTKRLLNEYLEEKLTTYTLADTIVELRPRTVPTSSSHASYKHGSDKVILVVIIYFTCALW